MYKKQPMVFHQNLVKINNDDSIKQIAFDARYKFN
jgi:hypothetical protein